MERQAAGLEGGLGRGADSRCREGRLARRHVDSVSGRPAAGTLLERRARVRCRGGPVPSYPSGFGLAAVSLAWSVVWDLRGL